jgi:hypothetical protein
VGAQCLLVRRIRTRSGRGKNALHVQQKLRARSLLQTSARAAKNRGQLLQTLPLSAEKTIVMHRGKLMEGGTIRN